MSLISTKRTKTTLSLISGIFYLLLACSFQLNAAPVIDAESAKNALKKISLEKQKLLLTTVLDADFQGVISASLVKQLLAADRSDDIGKLMIELLPLASHYALPPISDFRVGALSQGLSGALYLGANLEVAGGPLAFAVHAEQSAVNNALLHGEKGLKRITVTAAPCGHCRQFLNELHLADDLEIIVIGRAPVMLSSLLPQSFGPAALNIKDALLSKTGFPLQCGAYQEGDKDQCLGEHAAIHSYAPHSDSPSSVVLKAGRDVFVGTYIENVAYNPSLPPLQSALDRMRFKNTDFSQIDKVLLFEMPDARISQENYIKAVIKQINPDITFELVQVKK